MQFCELAGACDTMSFEYDDDDGASCAAAGCSLR